MTRNDPQMIASGYDRNHLDRYWTHPWMVDELFAVLDRYKFDWVAEGPVWECGAGRGDMTRAIQKHIKQVYSTDIDMSEFDRSIGPGHEKSFLDEFEVPEFMDEGEAGDEMPMIETCRSIITNPPYNEPWKGIGDDFIRHSIGFMDQGIDFVAMLMRAEFNAGKTRKDFFGESDHYMGEIVLTTRPRWDYSDPDRPKTASPRHNFSWFLWYRDWAKYDITVPVQLFSYLPKGIKL